MEVVNMNRVTRYFAEAGQRAGEIMKSAVAGFDLIDALCIAVVAIAVTLYIASPSQLAEAGGYDLAGRRAYNFVRSILIAMGVLILVDRRAPTVFAKFGVAGIVAGLTMNVARNTPPGSPLEISYGLVLIGVALLFADMLFIPKRVGKERRKRPR